MIPNVEPAEVIAGDTASWTKRAVDSNGTSYSPVDGWVLAYAIENQTDKFVITPADITASGDSFNIVVPASETATWNAGVYMWAAYATKAGERHTIGGGSIKIRADISDAAQEDSRSPNRKVFDAITAVIEGRATTDDQGYTIGSRQITRMPIKDLLYFQQVYAWRVLREENKAPSFLGAEFSPKDWFSRWFSR